MGTSEQVKQAKLSPMMIVQRGVWGSVSGLQGGGERSVSLGQGPTSVVQCQLQELLVSLKNHIRLKCLPMEFGRGTEEPGGYGKALLLVAIEQPSGRSGQDCTEFPAEVVRILHARIHTLATCGRVNMGGIAG